MVPTWVASVHHDINHTRTCILAVRLRCVRSKGAVVVERKNEWMIDQLDHLYGLIDARLSEVVRAHRAKSNPTTETFVVFLKRITKSTNHGKG